MTMGMSTNNASKEAQQAEAERQAQIRATTKRINSVFDSPGREQQISDLFNATNDYLTNDLNRQKAITDRNTRFALARSGQTGGSVSTDTYSQIGQDYLKGIIEANRRAQQAASDLRTQDEQARSNLIAQAQAGLDTTTASQMASAALRNNLEAGRATSTAQGLGDVFSGFADVYAQSRENEAAREAMKYLYQTLYSPIYKTGG